MNRLNKIITLAAFSMMVLLLPTVASAQYYPDRNQDDDRRGRNGGYNNGQYGNYGDIRSTIRSLKSKTRDFTRQLDRDLDRSRHNGSRREDQINKVADRFKDAVNDLDNDGRYNTNNSRYPNNNDQELRRVFERASQVERAISRADVGYQSQNLWASIRNDLQTISRYTGQYNNGRGNSGGWGNGRNNNGNRNGLPSWWPF